LKRFLLVFLTVLLPAYLVSPIPVQAQDDSPITPPSLQVSNGGMHDLPLKAIQDSEGDIDTQNDFEIQPDDIVTVGQSSAFHVLPNGGAVEAVKITDEALQTTDLDFSESTGRVAQTLAPKAYLLDVIVLMGNDDKYLYETVLAVLAPGQTLQQVNTQTIQNSVTTRGDTHTTVIFRDEDDEDEDEDEEEPSICYFEPNDAPECVPDSEGNCPDGFAMNEQGNCHPGGKCPDGFERADDDETGTCYDTDETFHCPGSNAIVLDEDDCAIYEPDVPVEQSNNDTSADEEIPVNEDGEPLDSNCGGVPCTASEKEDSWTSDVPESSPGVPITDSGEEQENEDEGGGGGEGGNSSAD
jgi:hypothetical protein